MVGDVVHQRGGAPVAGVVDPAADDVHQAALALVAPLQDSAAGGLQRAGHVGRRPGLVAEHRQRGVGQREVGVERRRLAQQLLAAGLEAHHPLQTGVVARRRLRGRRERQAEGVARTGDGVVAADEPAVLEAARHRGDGVEHVDRQAERLAADLGDRGRLPELPAPQRAQRPHRCVRPTGRVQQPSVAGPEAHPGGGRLRQGDAAAHGEEVVEHGVAEASYVEGGAGAVDHPADVVGRAVGEGDPQPAAGERRRVGDRAGEVAQPVGGRQLAQHRSRGGRHPVADPVPVAGVGGEELGAVVLGQPLPQLADPEAQPVHRRSPVAAGGPHPLHVLGDAGPQPGQRGAPVVDVGDRGQLELVGVPCGHLAAARHGEHAPVLTAAGPGQGEDDVDHGEAGPDDQHVTGADAVAAYDVQRAGRPRVRHEERRAGEARRRPVVTRGRQAGGDDHRIGGQVVPVVQQHGGPARVASYAHGPGADVAQRGGGGGQVEGVGERLVEVAGVLTTRCEGPRLGPGGVLLTGPPGHEVAGVLRQCGHARGRHVEEVRVVGRAERGAPAGAVRRVHDHHVDPGPALVRGAREVERHQRARGTAADDHDLGATRPRRTQHHDIPP